MAVLWTDQVVYLVPDDYMIVMEIWVVLVLVGGLFDGYD